MDSIDGLATILKAEVGRWEEVVFAWACDLARRLAELLLQKADQELMNSTEGGLKVEGFRERWVTTLFGDIRIKRRLYSDGEGGSRFLLDEAINDIAAQTNLQALDAATEAARAGDQGRGFAGIVGGIQMGVTEAVRAMEAGTWEVEAGDRLAADAGQAMDNILDRSRKVGCRLSRYSMRHASWIA